MNYNFVNTTGLIKLGVVRVNCWEKNPRYLYKVKRSSLICFWDNGACVCGTVAEISKYISERGWEMVATNSRGRDFLNC